MIETVISWNAHTFASDYEVDFVQGTQPRLPPAQVETLERIGAWPVIAALQRKAHKLALMIKILDYANLDALRAQLFRWFDPEDETPKKLIVANGAGVQQYVYALCEELRLYSDPRHQEVFVVTLTVDGDPRWRAEVEVSDVWAITASGQTQAITNAGEDEAYPVLTIKPTGAKTGGYAYRRWVPIKWLSTNGGQKYPLMATLATNALVGAGKMQADGDDLRVVVDGLEVYRWLDAMNSAATKIWFYTDFAGAPTLTLKTAIAGAGAVSIIELNEDISHLPSTGILMIGTEAFVYTERSTIDRAVSGVERAAKGTSAGAHNVNDSVYWIQHDVWIVYGNAAVSSPTVDANYKPAFELDHSTNTSWVYESFGDTAGKRTARWTPNGAISLSGTWGGVYTATQRALATPYSVVGIYISSRSTASYEWKLANPCGITNVAWSNGLKRRATTSAGDDFMCRLMYWIRGATWWTWQYSPASPVLVNNWEAESYAGAAFAVSDAIGLMLYWREADIEFADVTVTLNNTETPVVTVNAEQGNYTLACTITNVTTGDAIALDLVVDLNTEVEVDTDNRTVTWLQDGSRQYQALTLSTNRRNWLRLLPGVNTLRFDDTGTSKVTLTTEFAERYY